MEWAHYFSARRSTLFDNQCYLLKAAKEDVSITPSKKYIWLLSSLLVVLDIRQANDENKIYTIYMKISLCGKQVSPTFGSYSFPHIPIFFFSISILLHSISDSPKNSYMTMPPFSLGLSPASVLGLLFLLIFRFSHLTAYSRPPSFLNLIRIVYFSWPPLFSFHLQDWCDL